MFEGPPFSAETRAKLNAIDMVELRAKYERERGRQDEREYQRERLGRVPMDNDVNYAPKQAEQDRRRDIDLAAVLRSQMREHRHGRDNPLIGITYEDAQRFVDLLMEEIDGESP